MRYNASTVLEAFFMDTFVEQIVAIKKTAKTWVLYFVIALFAILLMTFVFYIPYTRGIFIPIDAAIVYGVFKLYAKMNIEYEYIITNSTMDIDKIIAKSSRKRVVSFDLTAVQRIEKYTGVLPHDVENDCFYACNKTDENAYVLFYKNEGKPQKAFVFAPNEKMITGMKNFLPRHICENLK